MWIRDSLTTFVSTKVEQKATGWEKNDPGGIREAFLLLIPEFRLRSNTKAQSKFPFVAILIYRGIQRSRRGPGDDWQHV